MQDAKHLPIALIILDGWGLAPSWGGNAISVAKTSVIDELWRTMPHTELKASGEAVGLPPNIMGNSEVGHLNIGAGKIVKQFLPLINDQIQDRTFYSNEVLVNAMKKAKEEKTTLHLVGIMSDGAVHGHINHLFALLDMAKSLSVSDIVLDLFTDGRDSEQTSALVYLDKLLKYIQTISSPARIGTITGRFYGMDRDNRWERTAKAYNAIVYNKGRECSDPRKAITGAYSSGTYDEFIEPIIIKDPSRGGSVMKSGDVVICFNFRADRMRQLAHAFCQIDAQMNLGSHPPKLFVVTFTEYQSKLPVEVAFHPDEITKSLSDVISEQGLRQFHVAETEKYAHVTYFFNGMNETPEPLETRLMIPSPRVLTYDQAPKMSIKPITDAVLEQLKRGKINFYVVNFANADMVGHTGDIQATVIAVEAIDESIGRIWQEISKLNGVLIITADHGNAEQMINPQTGLPDPEHTKNPVPFIIASEDEELSKFKLKQGGYLGNVAPTIIDILGLEKPSCMTLDSLIEH